MRRSIVFFIPALLMMTLMVCLFGGTANAAPAQTSATRQHHPIVFPTRPTWQKRAAGANQFAPPYGSGDLLYHNGPVEETPKVFLIFWGTAWDNGSGGLTQDGQIVQNYFNDVGNTAFENILTQYYDTNTHIPRSLTVGGTFLDSTTPTSDTSCGGATIQDSSIQGEVAHAIATKGWPADANATYFVYTPNGYYVNDGIGDCSEQVFCGYHSLSASNVPYAAMPYPN